MDIPLNRILNLSDKQVDNSKFELNTADGDRAPFIHLWFERSKEERKAGAPCVT